ncbi:Carboxyl-terminal processing protease [Tenacibaculum sp. 190524A02b]|uniref:S41 family peptidase n=1 Tax=Tenacibaculum vairaonense TaxID=3137860 RepID=UPI0032B15F70
MKTLLSVILTISSTIYLFGQQYKIDPVKIKEDLNKVINDISKNYIYLKNKEVSIDCLKSYYQKQIPNIKTEEETVLFFEYLLDELYDSHVNLNTNRKSSYRLYAPIYATFKNYTPTISNVWISQTTPIKKPILGAKILAFNQIPIEKAIKDFPTHCHNKNNPEVKEWILNKILAGIYNQPRIVSLKLTNGKQIQLDLDAIQIKKEKDLLSVTKLKNFGIIRIHNSLGKNSLISAFDKALNSLLNTDGLILDLRNTISGGDSYIARGIMSRFINKDLPYQKHVLADESWDNQPKVGRSWIEYVNPRGKQYTKPLIVLAGRWTGSMGEGTTIGFEGMQRATVIGTELTRLAGAVFGYQFKHQKYGYQLSEEKLYHVNGTPREKYIPLNYVKQTTLAKDETLEKALQMLSRKDN